MPIITKEQVKKCISLGTLNPKILKDFFYSIKLKSYDYDYLIQKQLVDLQSEEYNFFECFKQSAVIKDSVRDGYLDKVAVVQIDKDIVHYSKHKIYKNSSLYNKPQTIANMMKQRHIFKFGVLCFINNKLDLNFRIQAREDKTFLLFPVKDYALKVKPTDKIDVVFLPQSVIYTSRGLSEQDRPAPNALHDFAFPDLNRKVLNEAKGFIAFITPKDNSEPLFQTNVKYDTATHRFIFENTLPVNISNFTITIVGLEDYSETIEVDPNTEYLRISRKEMPIPKDNLLIMIRDANGYSYHVNTGEVEIKEYYPNIYKVINPNKYTCKIIVLYANHPQNDEIVYDDEIKYYLSKINLLERYQKGTVPDVLEEYKPITWDYLISDYEVKSGVITPSGNPWFPFLYKMNKISSIYKLWCEFFQTYLRKTYGFLDGWTLDINTIDLEARARMETLPELPLSTGNYKVFNTKQYLFTYRNDLGVERNIPYAWFIDGKFSVPTYSVSDNGYQYVYFDASLIKPDSIMEIERYDGNLWSQKVEVKDAPTEVILNMIDKPILANTLFITDADGNYLNSREYNITVEEEALGPYTYTLDLEKSIYILKSGTKVKVVPTGEGYKNKTVYLNCNNRSVVYDLWAKDNGVFEDLELNPKSYIQRTKKNIIGRIRIYSPDGRLYPKWAYKQFETTNITQPPSFTIMAHPEDGIPFRIEYMGYDEEVIYSLEEIPANGLLNLEGKINKPFSLVYHDVFLNGYKLNHSQIEIISPFVIAIKNVNTIKNLVIYERVKGEELFAFNKGEQSQYLPDNLFDEDKEFFDKILEDLTDIVVDPNLPNMDDQIDVTIGLIKDFLIERFINCDKEYTPEEFDAYETLFPEDNWRILFNADERVERQLDQKNWVYLSHDLNIIYNNK